MHKDGKWAGRIIALQNDDGKWGCFHTLSASYGAPMTTEQALRRLERLGCTIEDECIRKAVEYMSDCLDGRNTIPDRPEKAQSWDVFTHMMLAAWIRRFTPDNASANRTAEIWAELLTRTFSSGNYDYDEYLKASNELLGLTPKGARRIGFDNFYPVSLLAGCLNSAAESAFIDYLLSREKGMYYIYGSRLSVLPERLDSLEASRYLGAVELMSKYKCAKDKLRFVAEWLLESRGENGKWDMGSAVNDKVYFPLSDSWRTKGAREADCTERISAILNDLGAAYR